MKTLYYSHFYSNNRNKILQDCKKELAKGKKILYLVPSREIIVDIKKDILSRCDSLQNMYLFSLEGFESFIYKEKTSPKYKLEEYEVLYILSMLIDNTNINDVYKNVKEKTGFIKLVRLFIRRLKRLNIGFCEFREMASDATFDLREKCEFIAEVYKRYEEYKNIRELSDSDDASWAVVDSAGDLGFLKSIGILVLDGFSNLDTVHRNLLQKISDVYSQLDIIVNLPFKNINNTEFIENEMVTSMSKIGFEIEETDFETSQCINPYLVDLCRNIYSGSQVFDSRVAGISILNSPSVEYEVRETVREIKHILVNTDTKPDEVSVLINDIGEYRGYIAEIFEEAGIPTNLQNEQPLIAVPFVKDVLSLIASALDGTSEESIRSIRHSKYLSGHKFDADSFKGKNSTPTKHLQMIRQLLSELDVEENILELRRNGQISADDFVRDIKAFESINEIMENIQDLYDEYPENTSSAGLEMLYNQLLESFSNRKISLNQLDKGGARILHPDMLGNQFFKVAFILGVNEGVFPKGRLGASLFSQAEDKFLYSKGISNISYNWDLERQKLRFNMCLAAASKRVYISYRTCSESGGTNGQIIVKSPFVDEIEALMDEQALNIVKGKMVYLRDKFKSNYQPISTNEQLNIICNSMGQMGYAKQYETKISNEIKENEEISTKLKFIHHCGKMEWSRYGNSQFDEYDGLLSSLEIAKSDAGRGFNASQLNSYVRCPFLYFIERVLGYTNLDDTSRYSRNTGSFYHTVLEEYYRNNDNWFTFDKGRLETVFHKYIDTLSDEKLTPILSKYRNNELYTTLTDFLESDEEVFKQYLNKTGFSLKPMLFEQYFNIEYFNGNIVKGIVDRVDLEVTNDNTFTGRYIIYDYKKSSIKKLRDCVEGNDFQLPVYYKAIEKLLKDSFNIKQPECLALIYLSIEKQERNGIIRNDVKSSLFKGNRGPRDLITLKNFYTITKWVGVKGTEVIQSIKDGDFTIPYQCPVENSPIGCAYKTVCRHDKYRVSVKSKAGGQP